uniref:C3H1-type domain-containing protein n=1 Tax=Pyrodinium bahamense TaxID=73915 RepID=A0A7S0B6J9_9DINO
MADGVVGTDPPCAGCGVPVLAAEAAAYRRCGHTWHVACLAWRDVRQEEPYNGESFFLRNDGACPLCLMRCYCFQQRGRCRRGATCRYQHAWQPASQADQQARDMKAELERLRAANIELAWHRAKQAEDFRAEIHSLEEDCRATWEECAAMSAAVEEKRRALSEALSEGRALRTRLAVVQDRLSRRRQEEAEEAYLDEVASEASTRSGSSGPA